MTSSRLLWCALCSLLAGCSSSDDAARLRLLDASAGVTLLADTTGETAPADDATIAADTGLGPDALGGPGAPCTDGAECSAGWCVATPTGMACASLCAAGECGEGQACVTAPDGVSAVCVPAVARLCQPCELHADCSPFPGHEGAWRCLGYGGAGRFCGIPCEGGCPDGYACGGDGQCRREGAPCECDPLSEQLGAATACQRASDAGVCHGERACSALGLGECSARAPAPDVCNGEDDDCDGVTDGGDAARCDGGYACGGVLGCLTDCGADEDCASGFVCDGEEGDSDDARGACVTSGDDGARCDDDDECASDHCDHGFCCAEGRCCADDASCADLDEAPLCADAATCAGTQRVGRCEGARCRVREVESAAGCVDAACAGSRCEAGAFVPPRRCDEAGACVPLAPNQPCDDGLPCTVDICIAAEGCATAPRTGVAADACYGHAPATRGVGECHDGVVSCEAGAVAGCVGDQGPVPEVCNGKDDDCDGVTDNGADAGCGAYRCGPGACYTACQPGGAQCAPGLSCSDGRCVNLGQNGAPCGADGECASDHCENGACCAVGACCRADQDCAFADVEQCLGATVQGCSGVQTTGRCNLGNFQCFSTTTVSGAACAGSTCLSASCSGSVAYGARLCGADGTCQPAEPDRDCWPYGCGGGACRASCGSGAPCAQGATCGGDQRCHGHQPNGSPCALDEACTSGHCDNGFCCASGVCCGGDGDCGALDEAPRCADPSECAGTQVRGRCNGASRCETTTVVSAAACAGAVCGGSSCVNLSGLAVVKEGFKRQLCTAAGQCEESVRDCRDFADGAGCTDNSGWFGYCSNCSPARRTCVVLSASCRCE